MDSHAHSHGGAEHVPHVLPYSTYFMTWGALLVLTGITVGVSYLDFGSANIVIALGIAAIKATTVAAIFMHLKYDHRFHSIIFAAGIVFTGIMIVFTMFDTQARGRADAMKADRPIDIKEPFAAGGTMSDQATRERFEPPAADTAAPGGAGEQHR